MGNTDTELAIVAGKVKEHIENGHWQEAMSELAGGWRADVPFGIRPCTNPAYPDVWVKFKTRGIPYSLNRKWRDMNNKDTIETVLCYVDSWNLTDLDGESIELPPQGERTEDLLDDVEDSVAYWLTLEFGLFWQGDLRRPRKNSSEPLPVT